MPAVMAMNSFAQLVGMGGAPRMSFFMGQGKKEEAQRTLGSCALLLGIFGIVLTGVFRFFSDPVISLFGGTAETAPYAQAYFGLYVWGSVFSLLATGLAFFITAQGFTKITLRAVILGAGLNIVLDPLLIFGADMGVSGAAVATVVSQMISMVYVLGFLLRGPAAVRIERRYIRWDGPLLLAALSLGLSPFVQAFTESILSLSFNRTLLRYGGNLAVGAMTVFSTVMQISTLPIVGIAQGAQPLISFNHGAGEDERVGRCCRMVLCTGLAYAAGIWLLIHCLPEIFLGLFTADAKMIAFAVPMMHIFFAMLWVMGAQITCQMMLVALGNARASLFFALFRKVFLLIPLIYLLPCISGGEVWAVYLAEPVTDTVAAAVTTSYFIFSFRLSRSRSAVGVKT